MDVLDEPPYRLIDPELMRTLMQRTGDGAPVSIRDLATIAGVSHGTVHNLLTGVTTQAPHSVATAVARRIGVDLLVLWEPVARATTSSRDAPAPLRAVAG